MQAGEAAGQREGTRAQPGDGICAARLTHDEAFGLRELAEQFPEVLVPLFVRGAQHLEEVGR